MPTYLDETKKATHLIIEAYSKIGYLRDCGTSNEKDLHNKIRGQLNSVMCDMERLEQLIIANNRHDMKL